MTKSRALGTGSIGFGSMGEPGATWHGNEFVPLSSVVNRGLYLGRFAGRDRGGLGLIVSFDLLLSLIQYICRMGVGSCENRFARFVDFPWKWTKTFFNS